MDKLSLIFTTFLIIIHGGFSDIHNTTEYYYEEADTIEEPNFRWSMFLPRFVENWCYRKCRDFGKPYSRLVGAQCDCLCPINAADWTLCPTSGGLISCFNFCQRLGYYRGGSCLYNENCFCTCGLGQKYDPSIVYSPNFPATTVPTTTTTQEPGLDQDQNY